MGGRAAFWVASPGGIFHVPIADGPLAVARRLGPIG